MVQCCVVFSLCCSACAAQTALRARSDAWCAFFFLSFFLQDQQKIYDDLNAHKSHHHSGLGYHGDAPSTDAAPATDAAPVAAADGAAPVSPAASSADDAVAKARAIAAKLGLSTAPVAPAGESLKRKFGADVGPLTECCHT
jgi:hypothetical protein